MKLKQNLVAAAALMLGVVGSSFAALPAAVGTTVTALQSDASDMFAAIFPVVGIVLGFVIVIKLFKKFTSKI
jgi:hypothetical protein